jgi:pimeloyl-ACP methyl ester carboxylesterase
MMVQSSTAKKLAAALQSSSIFTHRLGGDHRAWGPQLRFFSPYFRRICYAALGYPPSDVPDEQHRYSQARARDDMIPLLDALGIERAHLVGLAMGAYAGPLLAIGNPPRIRSVALAACGYGAQPGRPDQ